MAEPVAGVRLPSTVYDDTLIILLQQFMVEKALALGVERSQTAKRHELA